MSKQESVMISPKVAEAYLKSNKKNRSLDKKRVYSYTSQMKKGQWKDTGDPIRFAKSGSLMDGQHRLHSIIASGVSIRMSVIRGLEEDVRHVLDSGKGRTTKDVLVMEGYSSATNLSSAVKFIIQFEAGKYYKSKELYRAHAVTTTEVISYLKKNPILKDICLEMQDIYSQFKVPGALSPHLLTALYFILSKKNKVEADEFFEKYGSGEELKSTSPIYKLRERFIKEGGNTRKLPPYIKIALFILAWNSFLSKKPMELLHFKTGQQFPKPL